MNQIFPASLTPICRRHLYALHADGDAQHADECERDEQVEDSHQQHHRHQQPERVRAAAAGLTLSSRLSRHHRLNTERAEQKTR